MFLNSTKKLIPKPFFNLYHLFLAKTGNLFYRNPSQKIHLIGVTGTKGKTTTSYLAYQIFERADRKTAFSSTVMFAVGSKVEPNLTKMGMPGRFFLPRFIKKALQNGIKYAILEVTSEGILQHRSRFLDFDTVVFTGLSPEHIERHGSFQNYKETKEKLFQKCQGIHIVNLDDKYSNDFLSFTAKEKWGITLNKRKFEDYFQETNKIIAGEFLSKNKFTISEYKSFSKEVLESKTVLLPFIGKYNAQNLVMAFAIARSIGISFNDIISSIPKLVLPKGRIEEIKDEKINFRLFLDYAHEPLSLSSVISACRDILPEGNKLICLTGGQGGGRDRWKRKVMGSIAGKICDFVIVATEDPYDEDPKKINQDVLEGVLANKKCVLHKNVFSFVDREKGILKALSIAQKGDIVLICGKGGEKKMCLGKGMIPWDEEEIVRKTIKKIYHVKPRN